jgi:hypothetical protein
MHCRSKPTQDSIVQAKQKALEGLDNDVQRSIFNQVSQRHLVAFGSQISQHQAQQRKQYGITESAARADSMRTMAQNVDVGSQDQLTYIEAGVNEAKSAMAAKGFPADSDETQKAVRAYRTEIVKDNVNRLMVSGQYEDAKSLLGDQMKAGNVDPDEADHLRASIDTNVKRVETDTQADNIFAARKGVTADDLEAALAKTDSITDPEMRKDVRSQVTQQFSQARAIQREKYSETLDNVVNYKAAHNGSLRGVDPKLWGSLDAKDRAELSKPPATENNVDVVADFILHPEKLSTAAVQQAWGRGQLAKGTYLDLLEQATKIQNKPEQVRSVELDNQQLDSILLNNGFKDLVPAAGKVDPDKKSDRVQLTTQIRDQIDAEQTATGRELTRDRKQQIMEQTIMNQASIPRFILSDKQVPLFEMTPDQQKNAYVTVGSQKVKLASIPAQERVNIMAALRRRNLPITEQAIANLWVQAGQPGR